MALNITVYDNSALTIRIAPITKSKVAYAKCKLIKDLNDPVLNIISTKRSNILKISVIEDGRPIASTTATVTNKENKVIFKENPVMVSCLKTMTVIDTRHIETFNSNIAIAVSKVLMKTEELLDIKNTDKVFTARASVHIKETNLGGAGSGAIGKLKMVLEVRRYEYVTFTFPMNFLANARAPGFCKITGDNMEVYAEQWGEYIIYTDQGELILRVVPGMRIKNQLLATKDTLPLPDSIPTEPLDPNQPPETVPGGS